MTGIFAKFDEKLAYLEFVNDVFLIDEDSN